MGYIFLLLDERSKPSGVRNIFFSRNRISSKSIIKIFIKGKLENNMILSFCNLKTTRLPKGNWCFIQSRLYGWEAAIMPTEGWFCFHKFKVSKGWERKNNVCFSDISIIVFIWNFLMECSSGHLLKYTIDGIHLFSSSPQSSTSLY